MAETPTHTDRLAAIRARESAATKGPWRYEKNPCYVGKFHWPDPGAGGEWVESTDPPFEEDDNTFIAHAREDIPYLLERVERLETALTALLEAATSNVGAVRTVDAVVNARASLAPDAPHREPHAQETA